MRQSIPESGSADPAPVVEKGELPQHAAGPSLIRALGGERGGIIGVGLMMLILTIALLAPVIAPGDPLMLSGGSLESPSMTHPMGTDALGRDLMSGVIHGARASLGIAAAVGILALACGMLVGLTAGYRGGIVDDVLMRVTEMFQALPRFFLVAVAVALFGPGLDTIILTLGLSSWPVLARVVRGETVAMRGLEFVIASQALGATRYHMITRVLLPHLMPVILVMLGLIAGQVLLIEASLGFLGMGDPNVVTWGMLAGQAQAYLRAAWWLALFPGLAITLTVLGFNLLADAVSSVLQRS
jgi:peptide/nickel transport system permease protein